MTFLKTWLFGVIAAAMAAAVVCAVLPKGKTAAVARCTGALALLLTVLRPLLAADAAPLYRHYGDWETEILAQTEQWQAEQAEMLDAIIAEKTAAYIQDKAAAIHIACTPEVTCRLRDGVPFPAEVTLHTAYDAALEALIAEELAIPAQCQYWQEDGV